MSASSFFLLVGDPRQDRGERQPHAQARFGEPAQHLDPHVGRRRPRLDPAQQLGVERVERDLDREARAPVDPREQVQVAQDDRALRRDAEPQAADLHRALQEAPRDAQLALAGLVGIGGGAERDALAAPGAGRERPQRLVGSERLGVDGRMERARRLVPEVLVGVGRVAVAAAHRAAAVGVHGPLEGNPRRVAAVHERAGAQLAVLDAAALADDFAGPGAERGSAPERPAGSWASFAFCSPTSQEFAEGRPKAGETPRRRCRAGRVPGRARRRRSPRTAFRSAPGTTSAPSARSPAACPSTSALPSPRRKPGSRGRRARR